MELHFYQCEICGKIIIVLSDAGIPTVCCGQTMKELIPGTKDGAVEKHMPVLSENGNTICIEIGSIPHPMTDEHSINWVCLETDGGFIYKQLKPGGKPEVCFNACTKACVKRVFAYCNIHGLWCLDVNS